MVIFAYAIVRGLHEGMIHIKFTDKMHSGLYEEGVRGHKWHGKNYHKIALLRDLFSLWCGWLWVSQPFNFNLFMGSLIIFWELSEIGYSIARNGTLLFLMEGKAYENINFADIGSLKLIGWKVYALHAGRIITGIYLIIGGVV